MSATTDPSSGDAATPASRPAHRDTADADAADRTPWGTAQAFTRVTGRTPR